MSFISSTEQNPNVWNNDHQITIYALKNVYIY